MGTDRNSVGQNHELLSLFTNVPKSSQSTNTEGVPKRKRENKAKKKAMETIGSILRLNFLSDWTERRKKRKEEKQKDVTLH